MDTPAGDERGGAIISEPPRPRTIYYWLAALLSGPLLTVSPLDVTGCP
jgi:hypothetical protein